MRITAISEWTLPLLLLGIPLLAVASQQEEEKIPPGHVVKVQLGSVDNQMRFFPHNIALNEGERYMLFLSNPSPVTHEFASESFSDYIETEKVKVFSAEGDLVAYVVGHVQEVELLPGGYIQWIFVTKKAAPEIDLICDIPGHRDAGMVGAIMIRSAN